VEKFLAALQSGDSLKLMEVLDHHLPCTPMQHLLLAQGQPKFTVRKPGRNKLSSGTGCSPRASGHGGGSVGLIVAPQGRVIPRAAIHLCQWPHCFNGGIGDHERLGSIEVGVLHD